jgi:two-component system response regulator
MTRTSQPIRILVADDDEDDRMMIEDAFKESMLSNPVDFVQDGVELFEYLYRKGSYQHLKTEPYPGIILLDLNMPRKDGRTVLRELRAAQDLPRIPVVILTTSKAEADIVQTYGLGVNSFITKPVTFESLMDVVRVLNRYWIEIVSLPPECVGKQGGVRVETARVKTAV